MQDEYRTLPLWPSTKACKTCGAVKPLDDFYRQRHGKLGRQASCKACRSVEVAAKRRANYEQALLNEQRWRENNRQRFTDASMRWYWKNRDREVQLRSDRYYANHDAELERNRRYREAHRAEINAKRRASYEANRERWKEVMRAYRERHLDRVRARDRNAPYRFAASHRRRVLMRSLAGKVTAAEWQRLLDLYDRKCLACGRSETEVALTIDHVRPVSKGGAHAIDNLQPLCKSCNSVKGTREIDYRPR